MCKHFFCIYQKSWILGSVTFAPSVSMIINYRCPVFIEDSLQICGIAITIREICQIWEICPSVNYVDGSNEYYADPHVGIGDRAVFVGAIDVKESKNIFTM
jgi:hypothetical protein